MALLWDTSVDGFAFGYDKLSFGEYKIVDEKVESKASAAVMEILYPKGSYAGGPTVTKGGCGFYSNPKGLFPKNLIIFEYKVLFPLDFDFVKGGKLPGLYGGKPGACGGKKITEGFSCRIMWRSEGKAELYIYVPINQHPDFAHMATSREIYGTSIDAKDFVFTRGTFHTIRMELKLNTSNSFNGILKLYIDNKCYIDYNKMNYSDTASQLINGIFFNTFFGGCTKEWASTKDTYAHFKDFKLSA
ncbi:MAG: hypothetical protein Hyperionvirus34_13 [Hyperionvirus sp.]|uniref:Polysaccharide lyase 14 domain-containing protein n=1 Tax=Hyperionvirus sp. TaxID=2487770 RepID=A0A3G5AH13_9VIRU|nr:MAG: hypothetical protein Hyperionvirus34_13 [Hyperionvirus sp.]